MEGIRTHRFVESNSDAIHIDSIRSMYEFPPQVIFGFEKTLKEPLDSVKAMLEEDKKKNRLLDTAWAKAEVELSTKLKGHIRRELETLPTACKVAIVVYTLSHPNVYEDFNEKSRQLDTYLHWDSYPYQGMWLLLQKAVKSIEYRDEFYLYRGCSIDISADIGSKICFKQFVSATPNRRVAESFAQKGTVFIFTVSNALAISDLSIFPQEEEYLLMPQEVFQVTNIKKGEFREIYLVGLNQTVPF